MLRNPNHILLCVTSSVSASFFEGQAGYLQRQGWTISLTASADLPGQLERFEQTEAISVHPFPLGRDISLWADAKAFVRAVRLFRKLRPTISNVGTPKAGLVMGLAAAATAVPIRIYTLHGLRLATTTGPKRRVLAIAEKIAMAAAHTVVCVSPSLREQVIKLGLAKPDKVVVNGAGSINGVTIPPLEATPRPRSTSEPIIGFVGRLTRDKGVEDLVVAFALLTQVIPAARLWLIGRNDQTDPLSPETLAAIAADSRITTTGMVDDVWSYYEQMTVLALPSYREGLPSVLLEGAAHALPTVATNATGCRDGFIPGRTGWEVSPGQPGELAEALLACLSDQDEAGDRGRAGRAWVSTNFSRQTVWEHWNHFYHDAVATRFGAGGTSMKHSVGITSDAGAITLGGLPDVLGGLPDVLTSPAVRRHISQGATNGTDRVHDRDGRSIAANLQVERREGGNSVA